jgi:transmembrane sensor
MKEFRLYELEDFVMDDDFIRWVQDGGDADDHFWTTWLAQNPSKQLMIAQARQIVASMRPEHKEVSPQDISREIGQVLQLIQESADGGHPATPRHFILNKRRLAAAVFLILIIAGTVLIPARRERNPAASAYTVMASLPSSTEKVNHTAGAMPLVLPDGSSVKLAVGSRITYANHFDSGTTRDVYVSGEAFFNVAANPHRPFRVITNEIITKVLGTSFSVCCYEKDTTISVSVRTGKVSVSGIIVAPNQRLVYQRSSQKFQKTLVDSPIFIVRKSLDNNMLCEEKPVEEVFGQLSRYYGITIVYDSGLLSKCTVTADLSNEPFYRKLDLICKAIGAKYELLDGQVVIQSEGCQ